MEKIWKGRKWNAIPVFLPKREKSAPHKPKVASSATLRIPFPEQAYTQPLEKNVDRAKFNNTRVQRFPEVSKVILDSSYILKRPSFRRYIWEPSEEVLQHVRQQRTEQVYPRPWGGTVDDEGSPWQGEDGGGGEEQPGGCGSGRLGWHLANFGD